MRTRLPLLFLPLLALTWSCGGGGGSPTAPSAPTTYSVPVVVFYDQDGNAVRDTSDVTRLGNVTVQAAAASATSARITGQATLGAVPMGMQTFRARADSLPVYFEAREVIASVPVSGELALPVSLPIGTNRPGIYLALGDSITVGDGAGPGRDYPTRLETAVREEWGQAGVINAGIDGNKSNQGAERIAAELSQTRPAAVLILLGTNDWNRCKDVDGCFTQDSVRAMLRDALAVRSLPFLGTIIPANPDDPERNPPQRNEWVAAMNERLKLIAAQEGAVVVDTHAAFLRAGGTDLGRLFADHVHPNDAGHQVLADTFFRALTQPRSASAPAALDQRLLLANPPGGLDLGQPDDRAPAPARPRLPELLVAPLAER